MNHDSQEFFVPVHGFVSLDQREVEVVNHPAFQRLRRIRQLGFAHLAFPGGIHTRFEHSIGAVHVAQRIVTHVNNNCDRDGSDHPDWMLDAIDEGHSDLIRLAALLHDVGHIPFGHTLEDELGHLPPHDAESRLAKVSQKCYPDYVPGKVATDQVANPSAVKWSLVTLVDTLYRVTVQKDLGIDSQSPFAVVQAIISKEPAEPTDDDDGSRKKELERRRDDWLAQQRALDAQFNLGLCRDVVGNTICADFLDYLYRDWHHLGKPLYEDTRIYQYMEARRYETQPRQASTDGASKSTGPNFVINIGSGEKIRHDALTSILQLLEARYELAETVLYHRAKLAITALLDRCLLEIVHLYDASAIPRDQLHGVLEHLLLDASDDGLPDVLLDLIAGDKVPGLQGLTSATITTEKAAASSATSGDLLSEGLSPVVPSEQIRSSVYILIEGLRNRSVYKMLYKLRFSDVVTSYGVDESAASKVVELYKDAEKRRAFLHGLETLCGLPRCSLVMYCPPTKMNAKVADVKLLIENDVVTFAQYDQRSSQHNLSRGALSSRTQRFAELWSAQVFLRRDVWAMLDENSDGNGPTPITYLRQVVRTFLFQHEPKTDHRVARMNIQPSVERVRQAQLLQAARSDSSNFDLDELNGFVFPSGLAFNDLGK